MVNCAVIGCHSKSGRDKLSFFRVPSKITNQCDKTKYLSFKRRAEWLSRLNRKDLLDKDVKNYTSVCSLHLIQGKPSALFDDCNPDWAPSIRLGYSRLGKKHTEITKDTCRHERSQKRKTVQTQICNSELSINISSIGNTSTVDEINEQRSVEHEQLLQQLELDIHVPQVSNKSNSASVEVNSASCKNVFTETIALTLISVECMTDLSMTNICALESECLNVNKELYSLRQEALKMDFTENSLRNNEDKVRFYTGLPNFAVLMNDFMFVSNYVKWSNPNSLSKFEECMIFFMRIRLNLSLQDLAYRFNVSTTTICRIFERWLNVMYIRLGSTIIWPERENFHKTMPWDFKAAFGKNVAVIVDCFEIFVQKPSSLIARAITWSQYKHHNTVKYLIGITPQGTISFISDGWGGRTSDTYLTENSGLLNLLIPGDLVLADRGFDISESVGFMCARLILPAFTKGKKQLDALEVHNTRKLASLRIHVERIIGLTRNKYHILQSILPIDLLTIKSGESVTPIDKIVKVSCSLVNFCQSVVPI